MKKITQEKIIKKVATQTGVDSEAVAGILKTTFEVIKVHIENGNEILFPTFGQFKLKRRKAKHAYNMNKREKVIIPERNVLFFIPNKEFFKDIRFKNFENKNED